MFIGFYNYTVYMTYAGLASAIFGMILAGEGHFKAAVLCLIICGMCDMLDGTIARTNKKRSEEAKWFGMNIDSLCDLVCFGVFPAFLGYCLCPVNLATMIAMVVYVLAAVIRLAYFNVQEITRDQSEKREYYTGLPVTASALIMPMTALVTTLNRARFAYLYPAVLIIMGFLFVLKFRLKKPYIKGLVVLTFIGLAVLFLTWRYGGNIICMKTLLESSTNV